MELANSVVAVTGATGMLGAYLCEALVDAGAKVRGVVRNPDKARFLESRGVEFAKADLMDRRTLADAFRGCDAIVSNAALYSVRNMKWEDNYRANKEGTENVYEAAASAGVARLVHISTFGVYRWALGRTFDDDSATLDGSRKEGGAYRATKQLSEQLAFTLSERHGLRTTALRPAGIYGARDHNLIPYVRAVMKWPVLPVPKFHFPMVYAGDVALAVVGALENDASAGRRYLTAGRNETVYDFIAAWKQAAGKGPLLIPIPTGTGLRVDCRRAEHDLGFRPRPHVEGLRLTFAAEERYRSGSVA